MTIWHMQVMVATVRCAELAAMQLRALESDQACTSLQQQAASAIVPGFAATAGNLVDSCLAGACPSLGMTQCMHITAGSVVVAGTSVDRHACVTSSIVVDIAAGSHGSQASRACAQS